MPQKNNNKMLHKNYIRNNVTNHHEYVLKWEKYAKQKTVNKFKLNVAMSSPVQSTTITSPFRFYIWNNHFRYEFLVD